MVCVAFELLVSIGTILQHYMLQSSLYVPWDNSLALAKHIGLASSGAKDLAKQFGPTSSGAKHMVKLFGLSFSGATDLVNNLVQKTS